VRVQASAVHYEPVRPITADAGTLAAQQLSDMDLDLGPLRSKLLLRTRFHGPITIREENSAAALEIMSRFSVDPKWLIYLPPTMAPTDTHDAGEFLEHPREAFTYFQEQGVEHVLCEEKHMGSRAVVVICRNAETARLRFGVHTGETGVIYTRTGRPFFSDSAWQDALLQRTHAAITRAGWWQRFNSDWFCLDCELMPWSAKAVDLIKQQYAQVGAAASARALALNAKLTELVLGNPELPIEQLPSHWAGQSGLIQRYVDSYQHYCWPVSGVEDLRLAPFHLLASEGAVHGDQAHAWHMQTLAELQDEIHLATRTMAVDLRDEASIAAATNWWLEMTAKGGEGMVVKPAQFWARNDQGKAPQPAMKCRGVEYLRIIYGPEYSRAENLQQLRKRSTAAKRSLAFREFALGLEALHRFVERRPLRDVHECVFGVLALESEPIDPRL
jgi:protein phosphatase